MIGSSPPDVMPCGSCAPCSRGQDNLHERFFGLNRGRGVLYDGTTRLRRENGQDLAMFSTAGLAEYSVVPATAVFSVSENVALDSASILSCSFLTAYGAARHAADLRAGQTVAVVAACGVGLAIIQLAKIFGASRVIAVDIGEDKLQTAARLGAADAVDASTSDPVEKVRELTDGSRCGCGLRSPRIARYAGTGPYDDRRQRHNRARRDRRRRRRGIHTADSAAEKTNSHRRFLGGRPRSDMPVLLDMAASGQIDLEANIGLRAPPQEAESGYRKKRSPDVRFFEHCTSSQPDVLFPHLVREEHICIWRQTISRADLRARPCLRR